MATAMTRAAMAFAAAAALAACQPSPPMAAGLRLAASEAVFQMGRAELRAVAVAPAAIPVATPEPSPTPTPSPSPEAGNGDGNGSPATPRGRRGGGGSGGGRPAPPPAPTPAPTPTPIPVTNDLDAGPGALAGVIRDVRAGGAPVPDAAVTVVSAADPTKRAVVATAADGSWQVPAIALGTYLVSAEKAGWSGDAAAVEVVLFATSPMALTVNFALAP